MEALAGVIATDAPAEGDQTTISRFIDQYDDDRDEDDRDTPFSDEDTLRALEAGSSSPSPSPTQMSEQEIPHNTAHFEENVEEDLEESFRRNFEQEPGSELPTSERTYGDTNQLLGINTRNTITTEAQGTQSRSSGQYQLREVHARSAIHITNLHNPDGHDASIHSGNSEETAQPDLRVDLEIDSSLPPLERCRGDDDRGRTLQRNYNSRARNGNTSPDQTLMHAPAENDVADWITEADTEESRYSQMVAAGRPSAESYADTSYCGDENRLSAISAVGHAPAVPGSQGHASARTRSQPSRPHQAQHFQRAQSHVLTDNAAVNRAAQSMYRSAESMVRSPAMAYHPPPRSTHRLDSPERQSSRSLFSRIGFGHSNRQQSQRAVNAPVDGRQSRLSNNRFSWMILSDANDPGPDGKELEHLRQTDPSGHRRAVDQVADLIRTNTTDRIRGMMQRSAAAEANRTNQAIMSGALPADDDRELLVMANTGNASQPSNASASYPSLSDSIQPQQAGLTPYLQNSRTIRDSESILNGRAAQELGEEARRAWAAGQPQSGRWTPTEDPRPALVSMRDENMPFTPVPMSVFHEGIENQNRARARSLERRRRTEDIPLQEMEPRLPGRRRRPAAINSQYGLRPLTLPTGSPSSHFTRAMTEQELMARENYWRMDPRHYRVGSSVLSARPSIISRPGDEGRMLVHPDEPRDGRARDRQEVLSRSLYLRRVWNPYMLWKLGSGRYDSRVAAESGGVVRGVGAAWKREALVVSWIVGGLYALVIVGAVLGFCFGWFSQH